MKFCINTNKINKYMKFCMLIFIEIRCDKCYNNNMNEENLKKSYMLLGPSGIGKSLLANKLSKKTGLPVFSIDAIISFTIDKEVLGFPYFFINKEVLNIYFSEIANSRGFKYEKNSSFEKVQQQMIDELSELFLFYKKELKTFKEIKKVIENGKKLHDDLSNIFSAYVSAYIYQDMSVKIFNIISSKIDKPVIFDMPCNFGWFMESENNFGFDFNKLNNKMSQILNSVGFSVLFEPGEDFEERSPETSYYFEFLYNHRENYKQSDLIVSTNQLFFDPTNKQIKSRDDFDAKAKIEREKLLNKAELNNICDQIIEMSNNLKQIQK